MPKPDGLFFATPLWQQPCRHQDASADVFFIGWFPQSCLKYEYVQQTSSNQHGFFRTVQGVASPFFPWYSCGSSCKRGVWTGPSVQRYLSLSLSRCRQVPCVWRILILEIVQSQQMLVFRRYIGLLQRRWWRIRRWRLTVLILIVIVDHSDDAFRDALLYQRDALQGRKPLRTWSSGSTHQRKVGDQLGPSICEDVKIKLFCQVWMFFYVYIVCSLRVHKGGFRLGFFWDSAACPQNVFFHSFSFQPFPSCGSNMFQC